MNKLSTSLANHYPDYIITAITGKYIRLSAKLSTEALSKSSSDAKQLAEELNTNEHWMVASRDVADKLFKGQVCILMFMEDGKFLMFSWHDTISDFTKWWNVIYEPRRVLFEKTFKGIHNEKTRILP